MRRRNGDHHPDRGSEVSASRPATLVTTLFISDLHLDGTRPDITAQFVEFLEREGAQRGGALHPRRSVRSVDRR
jgi:hypothetical protein